VNSRERVLAVLSGNIPDRVPWIENYVSDEVTAGLLGHENFITGFLLSRDNLGLMDTLPDPDDIELYRPAEKFLEKYKGNLAAICSVRSGPSNTYLSMGIEHFCQSIISDPELVREILWRFSNWTKRVVRNVQELPFDLFFMPDDIGFGAAPMISPQHFREFCVPVMKNVVDEMNLPVIYHSDGNIMPLMDDIISLGVSGVANMEPGPMNIFEVKKRFGEKITIVGNIDLHYTLPRGTQEETRQEVKEKILH
jgi:uroporphyrinogen decarboxylase